MTKDKLGSLEWQIFAVTNLAAILQKVDSSHGHNSPLDTDAMHNVALLLVAGLRHMPSSEMGVENVIGR